jgi:hypothetical protein
MFELFQTVVTVALSAIVGGQVAVTRTRRLQRTIDATTGLRDRFPADDPSRADLEAHVQELVGVLIRRQRLRFGPYTQAGVAFGVFAGVAGVTLMMAGITALMAAGVVPVDPGPPGPPDAGDQWAAVVFFLAVAGVLAGVAVRAARRQLREHPTPPKQPPAEGQQPAVAGEGS